MNNFNVATRTIQFLREQTNQRFIRRRINRRRSDFDFQFIAEWLADFISRRARMQLDR